jgi:hypothetical protein
LFDPAVDRFYHWSAAVPMKQWTLKLRSHLGGPRRGARCTSVAPSAALFGRMGKDIVGVNAPAGPPG